MQKLSERPAATASALRLTLLADDTTNSLPVPVVGAGLALAIAVIHLQDQGGLLGTVTGYLLSRTVGVPGDPGDIGNWGYLLGTVSLLVEGSFIVPALMSSWRIGRTSGRLDAVGS